MIEKEFKKMNPKSLNLDFGHVDKIIELIYGVSIYELV